MKRIVKSALITFLASRPITTIINPLFNNGVPIFMIHRVSQSTSPSQHTISADHLRKCFDYLMEHGYTIASLENLVTALKTNQKLPVKTVVFTMDDGYIDQAEIAAPIALEYNCPITFFIVTGMLDQLLWPWDAKVSWIIESSTTQLLGSSKTIKSLNLKTGSAVTKKILRRSIQEALKKSDIDSIYGTLQRLADDADVTIPHKPPPDFLPMTWDMARTLEDQGVHFAPHSASHNILSKLDQASMEHEIIDSWARIKRELKSPLNIFCYPNGTSRDFGNREIEIIKGLNFEAAVSTMTSVVKYNYNSDDYIYSLPRLPLPNNMVEFVQYCSWIERAREMFT